MLDFEISYKGPRGATVFGAEKVAFKTVEDLLKYTQTVLVDVSRQFLDQEIRNGTFPDEYITIVDNKVGASELSVKPLGKIQYVSKIGDIGLVIKDIFKFISERSAIRSGYYSSMNILILNGKVVAKGYRNAVAFMDSNREFKPTDFFRIINLAPYARKLERLGVRRNSRGKDKGTIGKKYRKTKNKQGATVRSANGTYWLAKNAARRLYPQLKNNIRFSFIPVDPSLAGSQNTKSFGTNYRFKSENGEGGPYLYPSITISINPNAVSSNAGQTESGGNL